MGGESLPRLRKSVVFERLLARLIEQAPDRWVIKGGVALDFRLGDGARATMDLDLAHQDDEQQATDDLLGATDIDLGDFFSFTVERVGSPTTHEGDAAIRYRVRADLADRRFEEVVLDIGLGDRLPQTPDRLLCPDILRFAGIERIEVPALPLEQHLAEKLHAYTRLYGSVHPSPRVKDLVDILLIQMSATIDARHFASELQRTFGTRNTHELPVSLPEPPTSWVTPFRTLASDVGLDPDVGVGFRLAAGFLNPVLRGQVAGAATWEPAARRWSSHERAKGTQP